MKISILGIGAYGIALAKTFYYNDNKVSMWSKFKDEVEIVNLKRENKKLLPDVKIPKDIEITDDLRKCIDKAKIIVIAVPMNAVRDVAKQLSNYVTDEQVICLVSKGIEQNSNKFLSEVVFEETKNPNICMLSGPSFAEELANGNSLGMVVASNSDMAKMAIKVCLENDNITINLSKDLIGVQLCAVCKNIYAIALGMLDGMNVAKSTRASVFATFTNDLRIILEVFGGKAYTIFTYAGIGDIVLTGMSTKSRNYSFGKLIGEELSVDKAFEKMKLKTIEGFNSTEVIYNLLKEKEISVKSIDIIYEILFKERNKDEVLKCLKK